ncbi:MAG: hypothetical protein FWD24_03855, partial [Treponema sp.]|nr:hypothetical protein [Treponema sp.]
MMSFDKIFFTFFSIFVIFLLSSCPIDPDDSNGNKNKNDNNKTSNSLIEFLTLLQTTAVSGGSYTYELKADEVITPQNLSYSGKENITITLRGDNTNRTISLSTNGAMFTVRSGVTLVLDNNL